MFKCVLLQCLIITAVCVLLFYSWDRVCFSPIQPNSQIPTERNPSLNSSSSMLNLDNAAFVYPTPPTCSSYTHSPSHDLRFLNRTTGSGRPTSKQVMLIWYPSFPHNMKLCSVTCLDFYIEITTTWPPIKLSSAIIGRFLKDIIKEWIAS